MSKGLSTEAGIIDTTTAGSALDVTPIASINRLVYAHWLVYKG